MAFHLTDGERHDLLGVGPLFEKGALRPARRGRPRWKPEAVIADKAYSAAWLLEAFRRKGIAPVIPSRSDQPENPDFDRQTYRGRNLVERLVGKLKRFPARGETRLLGRRVAGRQQAQGQEGQTEAPLSRCYQRLDPFLKDTRGGLGPALGQPR